MVRHGPLGPLQRLAGFWGLCASTEQAWIKGAVVRLRQNETAAAEQLSAHMQAVQMQCGGLEGGQAGGRCGCLRSVSMEVWLDFMGGHNAGPMHGANAQS